MPPDPGRCYRGRTDRRCGNGAERMTSGSAAESAAQAAAARRNAAVLAAIEFNGDGLVPAIAQQHDSGEVLMLAWMNRAAVEETLSNGTVCYWSRSRQRLW